MLSNSAPSVPLPHVLKRQIFLSWLALFGERAWLGVWRSLSLCLLITAIVISDLGPTVESDTHIVLLTLASCAVLILLGHDLAQVRVPQIRDACARLEQTAPQRPLSALYDRPFAADHALTSALWQRHITHMKAIALSLHARWPAPSMADHDPYAVRFVPILALVLSLWTTHEVPLERLREALFPNISVTFPGDIWMIPPDYIQAPPQHYTITDPMPALEVFAGGTILTVIQTPKALEASLGPNSVPFEDLGDGRQRARAAVPVEASPVLPLVLKRGLWHTMSWPVTIIPDAPPTVAFRLPDPKTGTDRSPGAPLLPVHILAQDDHGLTQVHIELKLPPDITSPLTSAVQKIPLNITAHSPDHLDTVYSVDMTPHPWAGLSLYMRVVARDGAENESASPWQSVTLPERSFTHPVAAALMTVRKKLALGMVTQERLWETLETLSLSPQDFRGDFTTFLGLRIAAIRLFPSNADPHPDDVADLLWNLALRVEDRETADIRHTLEQVRRDLKNGLDTPHAIHESVQRVRQALAQLFQTLAQRDSLPALDRIFERLSQNGQVMDTLISPLLQMLEELDDLTRLGATDAAKALAERIDQTLQHLQNLQQTGENQHLQEMDAALSDFEALLSDQETLLEETFSANSTQGSQAQRTSRPQTLAARQKKLHQRLGDIQTHLHRHMSVPTESLGKAATWMERASEALEKSLYDDGQHAQGRVLSALRAAQEALSQTFEKHVSQSLGVLPLPNGGTRGGAQGFGGGLLGQDKIPDAPERTKARDVLQELRRRALEDGRNAEEREYLNRLMRFF